MADKFIDLHCDTLMMSLLYNTGTLFEVPGMLDVKRMKEAGSLAQFFAIFMLPQGAEKRMGLSEPIPDDIYIESCFDVFAATMARHSDIIAPAYYGGDIKKNAADGKMSALLTFEDGRAIGGSMDNLKKYYGRGIRLISLTWNTENCFGYPNSKDPAVMAKGLTAFGKEALSCMNELGMLIDVSHLSDGGFYDVAAISAKPFIASHSNCRSLCPHPRNLTDDMIRILAEKGGVAGINFGPEFLNGDIECKSSTAALICKHIAHMVNVGGIECVALGSDFDGIHGEFEVSGVDKMHLIFDRLRKDGMGEDAIEKIAWKNAMRIIDDCL